MADFVSIFDELPFVLFQVLPGLDHRPSAYLLGFKKRQKNRHANPPLHSVPPAKAEQIHSSIPTSFMPSPPNSHFFSK